ncbi:MAG: hypothetical protein H6825_12400 [Planctomycetes bacterium]|nr:hypothetical protein [Planctomycetota bacterium]
MCLSVSREITEAVRPPRALFLRWPFGRTLGEPGAREQQLTVLLAALELATTATRPGTIVDAPWRWRRHAFVDPLANAGDAPHAS